MGADNSMHQCLLMCMPDNREIIDKLGNVMLPKRHFGIMKAAAYSCQE
jgi:hypothetical protein